MLNVGTCLKTVIDIHFRLQSVGGCAADGWLVLVRSMFVHQSCALPTQTDESALVADTQVTVSTCSSITGCVCVMTAQASSSNNIRMYYTYNCMNLRPVQCAV